MAQYLRLLMAGVVIFTTGASVSAQSLADAARRAEEQRQQSGSGTPSFTDRDLAGDPAVGNGDAKNLVLTMPLIQQYLGARAAITRAIAQSPDLGRQMRDALIGAGQQGVDGLERGYSAIPALVDGIRSARMTVRDFVVTEVAFMGAVGVLAGKLPPPPPSAKALNSNIEFLKQHEPDIAALLKDAPIQKEQPR